MRVAALQFDVRRGDVEHNLAEVKQGLQRAAEEDVRLVVLPEMWPTSFVDSGEEGERWLRETRDAVEEVRLLSERLELVVCGTAFDTGNGPDAPPFNRLRVFDRGADVLRYDKVHLFTPTGEKESFSAGEDPPPTVRTSAGMLSGVVCYDLRFAPLLYVPFAAGAEILVVPAQWPAPRATHWRALVLGRAVENQCFVVAANRTGRDLVGRRQLELEFSGNSLIADPAGRAIAEGKGPPGLVAADLDVTEATALRRRIPISRDRRPELYGRWSEGNPATEE